MCNHSCHITSTQEWTWGWSPDTWKSSSRRWTSTLIVLWLFAFWRSHNTSAASYKLALIILRGFRDSHSDYNISPTPSVCPVTRFRGARNVYWTRGLTRCCGCLLNQLLSWCFCFILPSCLMDICFICVTHSIHPHPSTCFGIKSKQNKVVNILEDQIGVRTLSCRVSLSLMFICFVFMSPEPVRGFWCDLLRPWFLGHYRAMLLDADHRKFTLWCEVCDDISCIRASWKWCNYLQIHQLRIPASSEGKFSNWH